MSRLLVVVALVAIAVASHAAEYVIRDPEAVQGLLAVKDTVAFSDAQLSAVLGWLQDRYQIETALGLDAHGKPDTERTTVVQPTLTISGAMSLRELLDLAAAGTGWTWSIDEHATVVFLPPPDAAVAPAGGAPADGVAPAPAAQPGVAAPPPAAPGDAGSVAPATK